MNQRPTYSFSEPTASQEVISKGMVIPGCTWVSSDQYRYGYRAEHHYESIDMSWAPSSKAWVVWKTVEWLLGPNDDYSDYAWIINDNGYIYNDRLWMDHNEIDTFPVDKNRGVGTIQANQEMNRDSQMVSQTLFNYFALRKSYFTTEDAEDPEEEDIEIEVLKAQVIALQNEINILSKQ